LHIFNGLGPTRWRGTKKWPQRNYARWGPLVTRREGNCLSDRRNGEKGITPSMQALMPESRGINAERGLQLAFRKIREKSVA